MTALGAAIAMLATSIGIGCGADASVSSPEVDLKIVIAASAQRGSAQRIWRLRCEPQGGNWPQRARACGRLRAAVLAPIEVESRDLVPITSQPVHLTGQAFGRSVHFVFDARGSSTRRSRFRALEQALGRAAFAQAQRRSR